MRTETNSHKYSLLLCALVGAVFFQTTNFEYLQLDDPKHIFENPLMYQSGIDGIIEFWKGPYFSLYIPVTYTGWAFVSKLSLAFFGELRPSLFHLANVLLHTLNTYFLFHLIRHLLPKTPTVNVFLSVFVFAFHPVQVETVSWISGFKDLLATTFCLVAIGFNLGTYSLGPRLSHWISAMFFLLSLLAKPSTVTLPIAVTFLHLLIRKKSWMRSIQWSWLLLAVPVVYITKYLQPSNSVESLVPLFQRFWVVSDSLFHYFTKLIYPVGLVLDYGRDPTNIVKSISPYLLLVIPACLGTFIWLKKKREYNTLVSALMFFCLLSIVLGWIPFRFQKFSTVADHYLYLPMIGLSMGIATIRLKRIKFFLLPACLALLGLTMQQIPRWKTSESIFAHNISYNDRSFLAHNNLGVYYHLLKLHEKAAYHFGKVVQLRPTDGETRGNLGSSLFAAGFLEEGIHTLEHAAQISPRSQIIRFNLVKALMTQRLYQKALVHAESLMELEENERNRTLFLKLKKELAMNTG